MLSILALAVLSAGVAVIGANVANGRGTFEAPPHCPSYKDEPPGAPEEGYLNALGVPHDAEAQDKEPDCTAKIHALFPSR